MMKGMASVSCLRLVSAAAVGACALLAVGRVYGQETPNARSAAAARLAEDLFFELDAPIRRVCSREVPT